MGTGTRRFNKRIGTNSVCHVHHLNNRGCVSIINGNYAVGNELLESALEEHKLISEAGSLSYMSTSPSISSASSCPQFCCEDSVDSELDIDGYDSDSDDGSRNSIDSSTFRIQRITTSSQLRTVSFPGQCGEDENHKLYHQVYRLPIVMDEDEWEIASIKDITFVLIFNTALCNHLMAMQLLQEEMVHQRNKPHLKPRKRQKLFRNQLCGHYFSIARKLYKLAMETLFSSVRGVDRIYYVAIFNNMSHVCKTMDGYNSQEALWNDRQLLKAIYWWKDFEKKASSMLSPSPVMLHYSVGSTSYTTSPPSTSTDDDMILNRYSEEDAEIVDLFLENVFYLICAKADCLPAAVA